MNPNVDREMVWLAGGVVGALVVASGTGAVLSRTVTGENGRATVANLNARLRAWWVMCAVLAVALFAGSAVTVALFAVTSLLALREFVTLAPTRPADHRALLWTFFIITPLQYALVAARWYGLFAVLIPVYGFLLIPVRTALRGDTERFLERTATIQWGLMTCVYGVSHAPALLLLDIPGYAGQNAKLLVWFIVVVQASDVLQYVWGKLLGHHRLAPRVSPNKTWEGFVGGVGCAVLLGTALWWATPFAPWQAAALALLVTLTGFAGGLVLSAVKRDRGVKDFGTLIEGHGGVLDRIDSLAFAAPVFFHLTRFFFT
jgi:phosphatidate cytidylyltransferase